MKKLIYCAAALATLLFAGSCQRENLEPNGNGAVTFTVTAPGDLDTRAIADGEKVNEVHWAVYKTYEAPNALNGTDGPLAQGIVPMQNKKATLELDLLQDQDYTVLFWAQVKDAGHYNVGDLRSVSVASTTIDANDETRDAFFQRHDFNTEKQQNYDVTLVRPFAQINLGTTLASLTPVQQGQSAGYTIDVQKSEMTVKGLAKSFSLVDGDPFGQAADESVEFTFTSTATPAKAGEKLVVNETEYHYVAMNYLFVPIEEKLVDVSYEITTDKGVVSNAITSVPVKENYRTNIIGNLLTSKTDFEIIVDERFNEPDKETDYVWGGEVKAVTPVQENGVDVYYINDAAQLAWIAQQVNEGTNSFKGDIVRLASDVDLAERPWVSIGTSKHFQGTFEGVAFTKADNTYPTIKNLYIENGEYAGLFGTISDGALLRNFNLKHVRINGSNYLGAVVGQIYTTVDNVTVEDAVVTAVPYLLSDGVTYDGGAKVGGIAGLVGQSATITNCTVKNATFRAYRDLGGIVGTTQNSYPTTLTGNTVEDLTFIVTGFYTPYNENDAPGHYDPIRGGKRKNAGDVIDNNNGDDIAQHTVMFEASEGAAYDQTNKVYAVTAPQGLAVALSGAGAAGAGNHTIKIAGDLDMTGIDWTPISVDGYHGADIVTVEGNGATIKGLDGALFAGGFAGESGIVIKDLTIEDATMIADNTQGYGAFVNCADSMDEITLINCHLKNSTIITPNDGAAESRIGGLVGWTAGYNNQNDGPVDSYITIQNCSVTGCTLKGAGSIGGICGHAGANAATFTKIENCTVTGNTLISTDDGGWRVGAIVGTANNGQCEINNVTVADNEISQTGKTAPVWQSELYGRFVPSGTGTLKIDGVEISATTPALVQGYTALYTADGEYLIYDLAGLKDFRAYLKANTGRHPYDRVYNIMNDIDAAGWEWESLSVIPDAGNAKGLVLNGNGKTISNLKVVGEGMFNMGAAGSVIKNITMDRTTVTSNGHNAAIFWGSVYSSVSFDNVKVKNATINGNCNTGAFVGGTYEPNNLVVTFKDCSVETSAIAAAGYQGQDPTGASGFLGKAYGSTKVVFEGTNSIDAATTINNGNGLVGGKVFGYTIWADGGFIGTGACDTFENWGGIAYVNTAAGITEALANGSNVTLTEDVEAEASTTAPYGNKYAFKQDGGVIDGQNHELQMDCYGDDYGIMTSGGTIRNLTIKEGCRAVMIMYPQQDVILDNVNIGGDGVLYPINTGEGGAENVKLIVTNSVLAGWTSYGLIESASFTNVEFQQGTYYDNIYGRVLKPYVNTTLTDCSFVEHMNLDLSALTPGHKIEMKNCTVNGQPVTASVFTVPSTDAQYDTELFTVDLPSWATSVNDCVVFE